jgi:hypothetical protein
MPQSIYVHLLDGTSCTGRQHDIGDPDILICDAHDRRTMTREARALRQQQQTPATLEAAVGDTLTGHHLSLPPGSIVLSNGPTGTAYQRHHRDGMFHGTNGRMFTQADLIRYQGAVVVYVAPKDER